MHVEDHVVWRGVHGEGHVMHVEGHNYSMHVACMGRSCGMHGKVMWHAWEGHVACMCMWKSQEEAVQMYPCVL